MLAIELPELPGTTSLTVTSPQVLVHQGHVPLSLYILMEGELLLTDGDEVAFLRAGGDGGPLVLPELGELDEPSACTALVQPGARVLCVPRTVALYDADVRALVAGLPLRRVSLMSRVSSLSQ